MRPSGAVAPGDGNPLEVGEVFITEPDPETAAITGTVTNRNLVVSAGKDVTSQNVTFHFRTVAPSRQGVYTFPVTVGPYARQEPLSLIIVVGPVANGAGSGAITLVRTPTSLNPEPIVEAADDMMPPYEGEYVLVSEESLANLVITFTAKGTMPALSVVKVVSTSFAGLYAPR